MDPDVHHDADDHVHCLRCVDRRCQFERFSPAEPESWVGTEIPRGCSLAECALGCGARYHGCKATEHGLLCPLATVPCANREYGCSAAVRRCQLPRHLAVCPASAVVCTMEWNRQMVRADRWPSQSPTLPSLVGGSGAADAAPSVNPSQLDAAWMARDQRRLVSSFELADSALARSLRSPLTPGWPAVPFLQQPTSRETTNEAGSTGGASEAVAASEAAAVAAMAAVQENLCGRKPATRVPAAGSRPERRSPAYHVQCSLCSARRDVTRGSTEDSCLSSSILSAVGPRPDPPPSGDGGTCADEPQTVVHDSSDSGCTVHAPPVQQRWPSQPRPLQDCQPASEGAGGAEVASVGEAVVLDLVMETYNSFRVKPTSMYTFRCAESFRRDEYASHYQNVHAEIQAGLNGWFEWRCPLAAYGCPWSFQRFAASPSDDRVVFSALVDAFGITSGSATCPAALAGWAEAAGRRQELCGSEPTALEHGHADRSCAAVSSHAAEPLPDVRVGSAVTHEQEGVRLEPPDRLTSLPDELLCSILLYVDSFSLNNVALTCKVLRNACCRLLDRRGMVSLLWKRVVIVNERPTWQCSSYVWTFSKHFAAVKRWRFGTDTAWTNHLAMCPFNKKHRFDHSDLAKHKMLPLDSEPKGKKVMGLRKQCAAERPDFF